MTATLLTLAILTLRIRGRNLSAETLPSSVETLRQFSQWATGWRHCLLFLLSLDKEPVSWALQSDFFFAGTSPVYENSHLCDRQDDDIACSSCYSLTVRGQWDLTAERCYQTTAVVGISGPSLVSRPLSALPRPSVLSEICRMRPLTTSLFQKISYDDAGDMEIWRTCYGFLHYFIQSIGWRRRSLGILFYLKQNGLDRPKLFECSVLYEYALYKVNETVTCHPIQDGRLNPKRNMKPGFLNICFFN